MLKLPLHPGPFHSSLFSMRGLSRLLVRPQGLSLSLSLDFRVDRRVAVRTGQKVIRRNCTDQREDESKAVRLTMRKMKNKKKFKKTMRTKQNFTFRQRHSTKS